MIESDARIEEWLGPGGTQRVHDLVEDHEDAILEWVDDRNPGWDADEIFEMRTGFVSVDDDGLSVEVEVVVTAYDEEEEKHWPGVTARVTFADPEASPTLVLM